jgi:uncharacterized membrane protein YbaN (DUF454 family)
VTTSTVGLHAGSSQNGRLRVTQRLARNLLAFLTRHYGGGPPIFGDTGMLKRLLLITTGIVLVLLGLVGLVVPVLPGVLFLALAAVCFSAGSPRIRSHLDGHPGWQRFHTSWQRGRSLSLLERTRLAFWLSASTALGARAPGSRPRAAPKGR